MKPITTAEARKNLAEIINRAGYGGERFVVTRHGKQLAAIVPVAELSLLNRLKALVEEQDFETAVKELSEAGTRSWGDVRRELDL